MTTPPPPPAGRAPARAPGVGAGGKDRALAFLRQAQEVEAHGGMALPDGSRQRTKGGVFFRLVRDQLTPEERRQVFSWRRGKPQPAAASGAPPTG